MNKNLLSEIFNPFIDIVYPSSCCCCGTLLLSSEKGICLICLAGMPLTNFHLSRGNLLEVVFWGRVPLKFATSLFFFNKQSTYRNIIHEIKYKNNIELAIFMGSFLGRYLNNTILKDADILVPVPLTKKKQRLRGYNQSEQIANGIQKAINIEVKPELLRREGKAFTQTKKDRQKRWKSIQNSYKINNTEDISGKHVIIVDDVITTGATNESCAGK
jgi:ComF family protein